MPIHFFSSKGMGPQSWEQLWKNKWVFVANSFFLSLLYVFIDDNEEPFWKSIRKKKTESKKTEK